MLLIARMCVPRRKAAPASGVIRRRRATPADAERIRCRRVSCARSSQSRPPRCWPLTSCVDRSLGPPRRRWIPRRRIPGGGGFRGGSRLGFRGGFRSDSAAGSSRGVAASGACSDPRRLRGFGAAPFVYGAYAGLYGLFGLPVLRLRRTTAWRRAASGPPYGWRIRWVNVCYCTIVLHCGNGNRLAR